MTDFVPICLSGLLWIKSVADGFLIPVWTPKDGNGSPVFSMMCPSSGMGPCPYEQQTCQETPHD